MAILKYVRFSTLVVLLAVSFLISGIGLDHIPTATLEDEQIESCQTAIAIVQPGTDTCPTYTSDVKNYGWPFTVTKQLSVGERKLLYTNSVGLNRGTPGRGNSFNRLFRFSLNGIFVFFVLATLYVVIQNKRQISLQDIQ